MAMNVTSETAIITGAGSGINLAFAQLLLEKGCNVVIADLILRPQAEVVVAKYPLNSAGAKAVFQKTDVRDWTQLEKMFEVAIEHVCGADIICPRAGSIIHISSVAGQSPFFPNPIYVATKHALNGFVRSLADLENPPPTLPKIRVCAVSPALILTPLWTDYPEKMKMISGKTGWVIPGDVAKVMLDLVEKEEHVGGTILEVGKTVRKVDAFNDPGPSAGENNVEPADGVREPAWESLMKQYNTA